MTKTVEEIEAAFRNRLLIYRTKQEKADPFGEDMYSRFDALRYVIEAIEVLAIEAGFTGLSEDDRAEMVVADLDASAGAPGGFRPPGTP
jgi:hypothetical protein